MNTISKRDEVHPWGEGNFSFPTAGGKVRLSVTDDALTPFGGLVPWAAYTKHLGIVEELAAGCPVTRTSVKRQSESSPTTFEVPALKLVVFEAPSV